MKAAARVLFILASIGGCAAAQAQDVNSSTSAFVSARDCISGTSGCDSISHVRYYAVGGNPGDSSASAAQSPTGYGTSSAGATLTGVIGAPILTVSAVSTAGNREAASAFGLQSYTYTGTSATQDTFGGSVSYSQTINGNYPSSVGSGIQATIDVFTLPAGTLFNAGESALDNYDALADAADGNSGVYTTPIAGFTLLGSNTFSDTTTHLTGLGHTSVSVTLQPGETVWVIASLGAFAPNGTVIDPTFTTQWTDSSNLVQASAVPEPSSAWLLICGLGLMLAATSRRGQPTLSLNPASLR